MSRRISYPVGVQGLVTRVVEQGRGPRTVLLIHGLGARADRWARNLDALAAAGYRAVTFDLPGHGFADKRGDFDYGVPGYARFVAALLDHLQIERAVIVGTSLGGHVAALFACENVARVEGLLLVGSTGLFPLGREARERLASRAVDRSPDGIAAKLSSVLLDKAEVTAEFVDEEVRVNNSPGAEQAFDRLARYFRERLDDDEVGARLAALSPRPPIELVWGAEDASVPIEIGRQAQRLLSPVPLRVIDGSAHAPYFERPEVFNPLLLAFVRSCS